MNIPILDELDRQIHTTDIQRPNEPALLIGTIES
jgi:hypothetical protein